MSISKSVPSAKNSRVLDFDYLEFASVHVFWGYFTAPFNGRVFSFHITFEGIYHPLAVKQHAVYSHGGVGLLS